MSQAIFGVLVFWLLGTSWNVPAGDRHCRQVPSENKQFSPCDKLDTVSVIDLTQTCASIAVICPVLVSYGEVKDM